MATRSASQAAKILKATMKIEGVESVTIGVYELFCLFNAGFLSGASKQTLADALSVEGFDVVYAASDCIQIMPTGTSAPGPRMFTDALERTIRAFDTGIQA